MTLTGELKRILYGQGADLVGIGDMSEVENCHFKTGVSVAVSLPKHVIIDLQEAPTREYYDLYHLLNKKLNEIVMAGEEFLHKAGFDAYAQTTDRIRTDPDKTTQLPHKTAATKAGLGWIGKNCLLVTPQYGSAVRISSLLTNAPLECGEAIRQSRCGACSLCVTKCPAQALKGTLWNTDIQRKEIVDIEKCRKKQREIMVEETGIETDLCGKCFAVCAYTKKYLKGDIS